MQILLFIFPAVEGKEGRFKQYKAVAYVEQRGLLSWIQTYIDCTCYYM